ncbi:type VI secretion system protein IglI family protein [Allofrancisella frigidaquae]|uniref:Uncharacterized protein n=1 Tax=Allofrancisella frigidaquae TaxID=1085644 RepID=A0A6M3HVB8_9GAMM|nr:type VI secretion system protein IglI family protein [Allofrancisella frigidaquae]KEI34740.1 hypothetical protein FRA_48c14150 [Francisella sp. W12-1067]QIV94142.1 hypothetical protein E3E15_01730 [Allofrancisella frigidaquae]
MIRKELNINILNLLSKASEAEEVAYIALPDEFEQAYICISEEDYLAAQDICINIINKGCIDAKIICYLVFCMWFNSQDVNEYSLILEELYQIYLFLTELINQKKIKPRYCKSATKWLYNMLCMHADFLKSKETFLPEDKASIIAAIKVFIDQTSKLELDEQEHFALLNKFMQKWQEIKTKQLNDDLNDIDISNNQNQQCNVQVKSTLTTDQLVDLTNSDVKNELQGSYEWNKLLNEIKQFDNFIINDNFLPAAILQKKIQSKIESFDPLVYFPNFFNSYLNSKLKGFEKIVETSTLQNHYLWSLLDNLYEVDRISFSKLDFEQYINIMMKENIASSYPEDEHDRLDNAEHRYNRGMSQHDDDFNNDDF